MKKVNLLTAIFLLAGVVFYSCTGGAKKQDAEGKKSGDMSETANLNVNLSESMVAWEGEMLNIYKHNGTLDLSEGSLKLKNGKVVEGTFVVDMYTMKATDEKYNPDEGKTKEKLIGHLSAPDFFDVENYPTASFVVTGSEDNNVRGNLTVKGISNVETIKNVNVKKNEDKYIIEGQLIFNRKDYEVSFDMPTKEKVLSDDIILDISLVAIE